MILYSNNDIELEFTTLDYDINILQRIKKVLTITGRYTLS